MEIINFDYKDLNTNDLFVCVLGYEPRSYYLLNKNIKSRNKENTLVIQYPCIEREMYNKEITNKNLSFVTYDYKETKSVMEYIKNFFINYAKGKETVNLYIDYSIMPRSWYCTLPIELSKYTERYKKIFYLYTAGDYPKKYESSQSAGIDTISVFSGLTLPEADIKRYHILGLSYDNLRTETIKSILEPDLLISCYAFNSDNRIVKDNLVKLNDRTIGNSLFTVALPLGNMMGMINKLCEIVYDHLRKGQVIIVPDGPKPLILAMSLVPEIVNRKGVTCLHVSRNNSYKNIVRVSPREDEIYGFQLIKRQ